jgi:hypothetical protein
MHDCASSGVRKLDEVAGVARRRVELGVLNLVGANALAEDAIAIKMAKLARDAFMLERLIEMYVTTLSMMRKNATLMQMQIFCAREVNRFAAGRRKVWPPLKGSGATSQRHSSSGVP